MWSPGSTLGISKNATLAFNITVAYRSRILKSRSGGSIGGLTYRMNSFQSSCSLVIYCRHLCRQMTKSMQTVSSPTKQALNIQEEHVVACVPLRCNFGA